MSPTRKAPAKRRRKKKASPRKVRTPAVVKNLPSSSSISSTPPRDKYELSPSSQAKCQKCGKKIMKGARRVGIHETSPRFGEFHRFYHDECFPTPAKQNLRLGGATPQQLISQQLQERNQGLVAVRERQPLRESLRKLRSLFAQRLKYAPFCVFHDTTLDELVIKMPRTQAEFLAIRGMGPKKYQSFGDPILQVISLFRSLESTSAATPDTKVATPQKRRAQATSEVIDLVGDDGDDKHTKNQKPFKNIQAPSRTVDIDNEQMVMETLTMEQIVEQKFKHAKENGYVIAVDI